MNEAEKDTKLRAGAKSRGGKFDGSGGKMTSSKRESFKKIRLTPLKNLQAVYEYLGNPLDPAGGEAAHDKPEEKSRFHDRVGAGGSRAKQTAFLAVGDPRERKQQRRRGERSGSTTLAVLKINSVCERNK